MINIKEFRVDKIVLLLSIIRKETSKDVQSDHRMLRIIQAVKDPRFSKVIQVAKVFTNNPDGYKTLKEDKELMENLSRLPAINDFESVYMEALKYKDGVVKRWEKLQPIIKDYYINILGLTEEKDFVVNVVHTLSNTGTNNMKNEIFYGHFMGRKDISFDATYIMHEAMHCMFPKNKEWSDNQYGVCHSLIELAIDKELRSRLGGVEDKYMKGHSSGKKIKEKLMPLWVTFLSQKGGMFKDETSKNEEFKKYMSLAQSNNVQNMNFAELMNYCIEHYQEYGLDENTFKVESKQEKTDLGDER